MGRRVWRNRGFQVCWAHNPKVAGSNPAPAMQESPAQAGFSCVSGHLCSLHRCSTFCSNLSAAGCRDWPNTRILGLFWPNRTQSELAVLRPSGSKTRRSHDDSGDVVATAFAGVAGACSCADGTSKVVPSSDATSPDAGYRSLGRASAAALQLAICGTRDGSACGPAFGCPRCVRGMVGDGATVLSVADFVARRERREPDP